METIKAKILDSLRKTGSYHYSSDPAEKKQEDDAVKQLIREGLITSVAKSIGYVNANTTA